MTTVVQHVPSLEDRVVRGLALHGRLRAAINFGNITLAQRGDDGGEPRGVSVDLAHELGRRLGVAVELVVFDAAGKVFDALKTDAWDVAFLAIDPARSAEIAFTPPYVLIEGAYLVRDGSPFGTPDDIDRDGVRVAVGAGAAYDLYLTRTLKKASLERRSTAVEAIDAFLAEGFDAAAGVRQVVEAHAARHPGLRVMPQGFMTISQAMGMPRGREACVGFLADFIERMKSSGFVADALARSGRADATVAPPATPSV
jgi:polar amino acid transport system substrate-binding protein